MADPLVPRPIDLCLVADAVIREAKQGKLSHEFTPHATDEAIKFLMRLGLGPDLRDMANKAAKLKGGGPPQ